MHCLAWSVRPHYGDDSSQLPLFQNKHVKHCNMFIQKFSVFQEPNIHISKNKWCFSYFIMARRVCIGEKKWNGFPWPLCPSLHRSEEDVGLFMNWGIIFICTSSQSILIHVVVPIWVQWRWRWQELLSRCCWLDTILADPRVRAEREEDIKRGR